MWNPKGGMDCIDLGFDFFLIKFELREDVDYILKGRPWFIGQHFLAIRQWEPKFQASTTTLSSVVVWLRLPELPIEFYEHKALLKIGRVIGPVLRIDANTVNGVQRWFGCLCVQVNLDKPLVKTIILGKLKQRKPLNRAREKPNDSSLSQMGESSHTSYDRSLSSTGDGVRATGKRKAPFFQLDRVHRDKSKGNQSYQNMTSDGKSIFRRETHASTKHKAKGVVDIQSSYMGLNKEKGLFVFGVNLSPPKEAGMVHSLGYVSQTTWTDLKPGPNKDLGVVRLGADAGMEKFIFVDSGEQSAGLPSIDEHDLGVDLESVVEVCNG
nr:hypothetical protein CFP56_16151 [Quercus suber]